MDIIIWPAVVLAFGITALIIFKNPLTRLIDRTEKVTKKGIQTKKIQDQNIERPNSKLDEFMKNFDNQFLLELERNIDASLKELNLRDSNDREKYLRRLLAQVLAVLTFEKIYFSIYNSQIQTLEYLNENRALKNTLDSVKKFYENAVKDYPTYYEDYSFDNWLKYLTSYELIQKDQFDIEITLRGKEFLKYMIDQGYKLIKTG